MSCVLVISGSFRWVDGEYRSSFISSSHRLAVVKVKMTVTALVTAMAVVKGLGGGKVTQATRHQISINRPIGLPISQRRHPDCGTTR
jgi:hypothetical protein